MPERDKNVYRELVTRWSDELVEKVARAIDETGVPESWRPHSKIAARAVIPIIEAALLRELLKHGPTEWDDNGGEVPEEDNEFYVYIRKYARERGLEIEE